MENYVVESDELQCHVELDKANRAAHVHVNFRPFMQVTNPEYLAAAPIDRHASYSGSALPFASPDMAFENTPNKGALNLHNNSAIIHIQIPNSYYTSLGTTLIAPTLYLTYTVGGKQKKIAVRIDDQVPFRSLTYDSFRTSAQFYNQKLPVRSQEAVFRDSAYPEKQPQTFWGLKPAL